ncbi:unnamed protein product, partial [Laminaria digitata]
MMISSYYPGPHITPPAAFAARPPPYAPAIGFSRQQCPNSHSSSVFAATMVQHRPAASPRLLRRGFMLLTKMQDESNPDAHNQAQAHHRPTAILIRGAHDTSTTSSAARGE